ncbi:MAG: hypothetical protein RLZZ591_2062 [Pseudomonadota bacterium]|jgi:CBS domain-containing protein
MFSVYGTTGQIFQGRMEHLPRLGAISPVAQVQGVQPVGMGNDARPMAQPTRSVHSHPMDEAHRSALAAYASTAHPVVQRHPLSRVSDLMSHQVATIDQGCTLLQAWQVLDKHAVGQAPVVDAQGVVVGMLSRADLFTSDRLPVDEGSTMLWQIMLAQSVTLSMRTPVPCVAADTDIRRVARVLLDTGLAGLPVVDDAGHVLAFVSRSDILRAVVNEPPLDLWG